MTAQSGHILGMITLSMTWITPFDATISACVTLALVHHHRGVGA